MKWRPFWWLSYVSVNYKQEDIILLPAHVLEILQAAFFPELSHFVSQKWSTNLAHITVYITDIEVNGGKSAIFRFDQADIFEGISLTETIHFAL